VLPAALCIRQHFHRLVGIEAARLLPRQELDVGPQLKSCARTTMKGGLDAPFVVISRVGLGILRRDF